MIKEQMVLLSGAWLHIDQAMKMVEKVNQPGWEKTCGNLLVGLEEQRSAAYNLLDRFVDALDGRQGYLSKVVEASND